MQPKGILLKPAKIFLFIYNYIYPFFGFPLLLWLWTRSTSLLFAALVMGLPLVFGYLIPGIGTNILKLWRFRGHWLMGNYFIHHGIIYASTMGLALYLSFFATNQLDVWNMLGNIARTSTMIGFVGWWHDILAVRHGVIEIYNGPWKHGASPETIVSHATPYCYVFLGAAYAGIATLGYPMLTTQNANINHFGWLFLLGLILMTLGASVPYLLLEPQ